MKYEAASAAHEKMMRSFVTAPDNLNEKQVQAIQRILDRHKELK